MKGKGVLLWMLLAGFIRLHAQYPILDEYIRSGLESNHALKQKELDYASSLSALKAAKGLYFPDVSLNARYTVANGGRIIEFPVGDLLNPVYSTLNVLTASDMFPQLENQAFPFYRPKEHETKVSLVQPIFSSEIIHNYRIQREYSEIAKIDMDRYRNELVREITKAYFGYVKAVQFKSLADTTLALANENLRVSERLFENDKVTIDAVYRSRSELAKLEVRRAQAMQLTESAGSYFNFLLNRPLESPIRTMEVRPVPVEITLEDAIEQALNNREELKQVEGYRKLNVHATGLQKGNNLPGIFGVVDYGFQGPEYSFTGEDDFVMASIVMKWELFQGTANRNKVQQSKIEGEKINHLLEQTRQQIRLEVINAYYALESARESVASSEKQIASARRAYDLIHRKYQEGQASLLELIDARTSLTGAVTNSIVANGDFFSNLADFNYSIGKSYPEF